MYEANETSEYPMAETTDSGDAPHDERAQEGPPPSGFEFAVEAAAAAEASPAQLQMLADYPEAWRWSLERLLHFTDESLEAVRRINGPERDQVVADFELERDRLEAALARLLGDTESGQDPLLLESAGEVRLQASWAAGRLVIWAAGPAAAPASAAELQDMLNRAGVVASGWATHPPVKLPSGAAAPALALPIVDALGWLANVGAGHDDNEAIGSSVTWLGRVAILAVRKVAAGQIVPTVRSRRRGRTPEGEEAKVELSVRWAPALLSETQIKNLAAAMPGPLTALERTEPRQLTMNVLGAIVNAIATDAASRLTLPAAPPNPVDQVTISESLLTRLDGSSFEAPTKAATEISRRMDRWSNPVTTPSDARLVVQLQAPDSDGAWFLSVQGPDPDGKLVPLEVALIESRPKRHLADELARLERLIPVLKRPGAARRGEVIISQDEAWELMSETGPRAAAAGFDVRVPALSRKKATPALRLDAIAKDPSVVGANQLADVRWSAVFDDVELSAAQIAELAREARPLIRSRGQWVEVDRADLAQAAAVLAEREKTKQLTGAEVLRFAMGLDASPLAGGVSVGGSSWAADLLAKSAQISKEPITKPDGFNGELRSYQGEAVSWLGFLDSVELGGCLALDMGLGKTPTMLAHIARTAGSGPALVIAPPAVVGNWASEAAKFTPDMKVLVHHGASRSSETAFEKAIAGKDIIITTYGTAVRDVEALSKVNWDRMVLDEAQAIKNPANETSQQLRRIPSRVRIALTGTPIENGLSDLWSILDFTNPGLVGTRPSFVAQLSTTNGSSKKSAESALRALNGLLVFRRTKSEPEVAKELPERIDQLDHCSMTAEQIGLYQAVLDNLVAEQDSASGEEPRKGAVLAAITALKQICNHPVAYQADDKPLAGRSGKLARLEEIVEAVFAADERILVFTHFASWGVKLAEHLSEFTGTKVDCYHGGLSRGVRDKIIEDFQNGEGAGALVLSLKAGGTGLNLTAASHVVLYDRWWNPAVEDQARDRAWRIGQTRTVVSHRLVCPGTVDERVEEVVSGKRHIADLVLPKSSSLADLDAQQLRTALGLRDDLLMTESSDDERVREQTAQDFRSTDPEDVESTEQTSIGDVAVFVLMIQLPPRSTQGASS
ncbi:MAG: DEAD/DEAH box helicase [Microthrixaceae bacterium]|nr:DEAD/DEAH box helicase [Microthrixaceae bacterium]